MTGAKMVAIISEAASSGISLQADKRRPNIAQRVHITLELPWSADEALQQLGRSHRSNQASAPQYKLLMTEVGGERRFAAELAKRLQQLGALTKGDRRAADNANLSQFDFQTKYGKNALEEVVTTIASRRPGAGSVSGLLKAVLGEEAAKEADESGDYRVWEEHCAEVEGAFLKVGIDMSKDASPPPVKMFLNRLLGLQTKTQSAVFKHFCWCFDDLIARDKSEGRFDDGVVDLKANKITVKATVPFYTDPVTAAKATLHTLQLDRGLPWDLALKELEAANERERAAGNSSHLNGFYSSRNDGSMGRKHQHLLIRKVYQYGQAERNTFYEVYRVLRPNLGAAETMQRGDDQPLSRYIRHDLSTPAGLEKAKRMWEAIFTDSTTCLHAKLPNGSCRTGLAGCKWGSRMATEAVASACSPNAKCTRLHPSSKRHGEV